MIETLGVCEVWAGFGRVGNLKRKPKNRIERGVRGILRESRIGFWEGGVAKSITSFFGSFSRLSSERGRLSGRDLALLFIFVLLDWSVLHISLSRLILSSFRMRSSTIKD